MADKEQKFNYQYSGSEQSEIRKIREKYEDHPKQESKIDELRRLDKSVQKAGLIPSAAIGILGTLLMGIGMCCTMIWGYMVCSRHYYRHYWNYRYIARLSAKQFDS